MSNHFTIRLPEKLNDSFREYCNINELTLSEGIKNAVRLLLQTQEKTKMLFNSTTKIDYNELAIEYYSSFVCSEDWNELFEETDASQEIKDIIAEYGIGTHLDENGDYYHESGCLYDDIPVDKRSIVRDDEHGSELMYNLAEAFSKYIKNIAG